jgi:hypothetical protein
MAMTDFDDLLVAELTVRWIKTVRAAGPGVVMVSWLPSENEIKKSALLARLLAGKNPLPYPPPCAYSYPWYAIVEDIEPTIIKIKSGLEIWFHSDGLFVNINQNKYSIIEKFADKIMVIRDDQKETPYRFLLWWEDRYSPEHTKNNTSGSFWMLKNITPSEILNIQQ